MNTWSYSSLSLFKQCPRKYHRLRVVKDVKEDDAEHLIYGNAVHKAAELAGSSSAAALGTEFHKLGELIQKCLHDNGLIRHWCDCIILI